MILCNIPTLYSFCSCAFCPLFLVLFLLLLCFFFFDSWVLMYGWNLDDWFYYADDTLIVRWLIYNLIRQTAMIVSDVGSCLNLTSPEMQMVKSTCWFSLWFLFPLGGSRQFVIYLDLVYKIWCDPCYFLQWFKCNFSIPVCQIA